MLRFRQQFQSLQPMLERETNVCRSLGSKMGLIGSLAHHIGLGQPSSRPLLQGLCQQPGTQGDQDEARQQAAVQQETWSRGSSFPWGKGALTASEQGPAAQKRENGLGCAGRQLRLRSSVARKEKVREVLNQRRGKR